MMRYDCAKVINVEKKNQLYDPYWSSKYLCSLELKIDKINAIAILAILTLALQCNAQGVE